MYIRKRIYRKYFSMLYIRFSVEIFWRCTKNHSKMIKILKEIELRGQKSSKFSAARPKRKERGPKRLIFKIFWKKRIYGKNRKKNTDRKSGKRYWISLDCVISSKIEASSISDIPHLMLSRIWASGWKTPYIMADTLSRLKFEKHLIFNYFFHNFVLPTSAWRL